jgi:hypothetical protein
VSGGVAALATGVCWRVEAGCGAGRHGRPRPERRALRRTGVPACRNSWDDVDRLLADWAGQRPDLDFTPVGVVTRLSRLCGYLDAELAGVFARFGLTSADFLSS